MSERPVIARRGPWKIHGGQTAYENPWIALETYEVTLPRGGDGVYGVVSFRNLAVGVLPVDEDGFTWLVGQHRFALDLYSWELPEGGGPLGEDPLETARRELREETGFSAKNYLPVCDYHTSNSVTDERAVGYLAWDLVPGQTDPDPSEDLVQRRVSLSELLEDVMGGRVTDGFTITMLLSAHMKFIRGELPEAVAARFEKGLAL